MNFQDFRSMIIRREEPDWLNDAAKKARKLHRERKQFEKMRGGPTAMCKKVIHIIDNSGFTHMAVGHIFHCSHCKERFTGPDHLCDLFARVNHRRVCHLPQLISEDRVEAADKHAENCARCWRIVQESKQTKRHDCLRFKGLLDYAIKDPEWLHMKYPDALWFYEHRTEKCGMCSRLFLEHFPNGY